MKIAYLIRHSEPLKEVKLNYTEKISNQEQNEKIPLSSNGEILAKEIFKEKLSGKIDELWSSSYIRAISTAKYISEYNNNIPMNISKYFNERKLGNTQNIKDEFWLEQLYDENIKIGETESRKEVADRMLLGINKILDSKNNNIAIVTHATAITFFLMKFCTLKNTELEGKKRWLLFNNKTIINDKIKTPDIFKLTFLNKKLINIERI